MSHKNYLCDIFSHLSNYIHGIFSTNTSVHKTTTTMAIMNGSSRLTYTPLWFEAIISSDFEVDTLPLVFASYENFDIYYSTLCSKYPRKKRDTINMRKCCEKARDLRVKGKLIACLDMLQQSLDIRKQVFENEDYQLVAAQHHLCLISIHFASHALAREKTSASYELFNVAKKTIEKTLPGNERPLFEVILYNNWANYWYRRNRPCSTCQAAGMAAVKWGKLMNSLPDSNISSEHLIIGSCLNVRFATAQLLNQRYQESHDLLSSVLSSLRSITAESLEINNRQSSISVNNKTFLIRPHSPGSNSTQFPLSTLNICLSSPYPHYHTNWPVLQTLNAVSQANMGFAKSYLLKFSGAVQSLKKCAILFNNNLTNCGEGNAHWWQQVQIAYQYCQLSVSSTAKLRVDHRNNLHTGLQHVLQEQTHITKLADDAADDNSDSGDDSILLWRHLVPCLKKKLTYKEAVKQAKGKLTLRSTSPDLGMLASRVLDKKSSAKVNERDSERNETEEKLKSCEAGNIVEGESQSKYHLMDIDEILTKEMKQRLVTKQNNHMYKKRTRRVEKQIPTAVETYFPNNAGDNRIRQTTNPQGRIVKDPTPAEILSDSFFEFYCPSTEPPEDPAHEATKLKLAVADKEQQRLDRHLSYLQKEMEQIVRRSQELSESRAVLQQRVDEGPNYRTVDNMNENQSNLTAFDTISMMTGTSTSAIKIISPSTSPALIPSLSNQSYCDTSETKAPGDGVQFNCAVDICANSIVKRATAFVDPKPVTRKKTVSDTDSNDSFYDDAKRVYVVNKKKSKATNKNNNKKSHNSLVGIATSTGDRQQRLRALLPHLDPNGEMYRMVTKELASNQQILTRKAKEKRLQRMVEVAKKGRLALRCFSMLEQSKSFRIGNKPPLRPITSSEEKTASVSKWLAAAATWAACLSETDLASLAARSVISADETIPNIDEVMPASTDNSPHQIIQENPVPVPPLG